MAGLLRTFSCAIRLSKRELLCARRPKDTGLMYTFCREHPSPSPRPVTLGSGNSGQSRTGLWVGEGGGGLPQAPPFSVEQTEVWREKGTA